MTPSLFSPGPRQDRRLRADLSAYDRLNQSPFPHDAHARELIDCWWRALPPPARESIAKRFVNKRREQHLGAFFELYMSAMTARLFSGVKLDVGQEDDTTRDPDLFVINVDSQWSIEATVVLGDDVVGPDDRPRVGLLYEAIQRIRTREYLIGVNLLAIGSGNPSRRNVTAELDTWLQGLDVDEQRARAARNEPPCERLIEWDGWRVKVTAMPWRDGTIDAAESVIGFKIEGMAGHKHVFEGERTIEIDGPRKLSDSRMLADALRRKARRGQRLDDRPWVIAVMCAGDLVNDRDIVQALLGRFEYPLNPRRGEPHEGVHQTGGLWHQGDGWRYGRVSAVLTVCELSPLSVAAVEPTVWLNPAAEHPLLVGTFPWRTMHIRHDLQVTEEQAISTAAEVFGILRTFPRSRAHDPS
jgi:hypothetical protein